MEVLALCALLECAHDTKCIGAATRSAERDRQDGEECGLVVDHLPGILEVRDGFVDAIQLHVNKAKPGMRRRGAPIDLQNRLELVGGTRIVAGVLAFFAASRRFAWATHVIHKTSIDIPN